MSDERSILSPGVLEAGLMSIVECPVCARNLNGVFNQPAIIFNRFGANYPEWEPEFCPKHPDAKWK